MVKANKETLEGIEIFCIHIPQNDLNTKIDINGEIKTLVNVDQLEKLLFQLKDQKKDLLELKNCVVSVLRLMGLLDEKTGTIKESVRSGNESYFKHIIKALKDVVMLMTMARFNKASETELMEKFAFIKTVLPLVDKYAK